MKVMSRVIIVILFTALVVQTGFTQEPVHWEIVSKIREEGLNNSEVMKYASYLTDVYGPRLAGSPQYDRAAEWAKDTFEKIGMVNVDIETYGDFGIGWENNYTSVHMMKPMYSPIIAYPRAWTKGTDGKITGKPIFINRDKIFMKSDLDIYQGKLKGVIVFTTPRRKLEPSFEPDASRRSLDDLDKLAETSLKSEERMVTIPRSEYNDLLSGEMVAAPKPLSSSIIYEFIQNEGAAVIVEVGRGDDGTVFVSGDELKTTDTPRPIARLTMAAEHYNRIIRIIEKDISVEMEIEIRNKFYDQEVTDQNVIAEIEGTDLAHEIVMLGGHFDSWHTGTGATDNASGTAVVMEAMRILKKIGITPRRTIRAALWGAEEQGYFGSDGYINKHFAKTTGNWRSIVIDEILPDHANLAGYFNYDNGTGRIRGVYLQENEFVRPIFEAWMKPLNDLGVTHLTRRNTGGTDHIPFNRVGLPGFQFIQDNIEYNTKTHHSNMDVYDRLIAEDLMQSAVVMATFIYHTAMRDQKLPRKPMPQK